MESSEYRGCGGQLRVPPAHVRLMLVLFFIFVFPRAALCTSDTSTCYDVNGDSQSTWLSCQPDAGISGTCCSEGDYCASNGLCLNADGNNWFSMQGCTDSDWHQNCLKACTSDDLTDTHYAPLWMCNKRNATTGTVDYCCGQDPDCCNGDNLDTIAVATSFWRPPDAAAATATTTPTSTCPADSSSTEDNSTVINTILAVGLGVGLGIGIPLECSILYLIWQWRKSKKRLAAGTPGSEADPSAAASKPISSPSSPSPAITGGGLIYDGQRQEMASRSPARSSPAATSSQNRHEQYTHLDPHYQYQHPTQQQQQLPQAQQHYQYGDYVSPGGMMTVSTTGMTTQGMDYQSPLTPRELQTGQAAAHEISS